MKREARFWEKKENNKVQCNLCPHRCIIPDGKRGICKVRENDGGKLFTLIYGSASSIAMEPIEKKPLYHFYPNSCVFSMGTVGCNMFCKHCQNYSISSIGPDDIYLRELNVDEPAKLAKQYGCRGIAWTYNEPTIWHEFSIDASKIAKKEKLYVVYVSNGYINEDPFREVSKYIDAINIDVKAFNDDFYKKITGAKLQPVLDTCILAKELNLHLELTYLIIPGKNDSMDEIGRFCDWVLNNVGADIPVHFSRFYPHYKMADVPPTPLDTLLRAYSLANDKGLRYVYLGNVPHGDYENTYCPKCGNLLIERHGFSSEIKGIINGKCSRCGMKIPVIMDLDNSNSNS